jgi:hypothetical protein
VKPPLPALSQIGRLAVLVAILGPATSYGQETVNIRVWSDAQSVSGGPILDMRYVEIDCDREGCHWGGHPIERGAVDAFLKRLTLDAKHQIDLTELIDLELTTKSAHAEVDRITSDPYLAHNIPESRRISFLRFMSDKSWVESRLLAYYDPHNVTSCGSALVRGKATWSSRAVEFQSAAAKLFMIPWEIKGNGEVYSTYDPVLSRMLAAILPPKFLNLEAIRGDSIRQWLLEEGWSAARAATKRKQQCEQPGRSVTD